MVRGLDSVSSYDHPVTVNAGGVGPLPGKQPAKREQPKQVYEDPTATNSSTRERIYNVLQALHSYLEAAQRGLKFRVHEDTGQLMVQVIAKEDGRVIREIPSEQLLDMEGRIDEMTGVLFSKGV